MATIATIKGTIGAADQGLTSGLLGKSTIHGTLSCVAADRHIHKLRTMAAKHLGIQLAGSNPKLRLSLAVPHTADPGFYTSSSMQCWISNASAGKA